MITNLFVLFLIVAVVVAHWMFIYKATLAYFTNRYQTEGHESFAAFAASYMTFLLPVIGLFTTMWLTENFKYGFKRYTRP